MTRFTREAGFTLMELMIVVAILAMIAAAILGVYQVSQAIYIRSASLEDAQLSARAGLDRMAIELRLAGAYVSGAVNPFSIDVITAASSTSVTFRGDVNGDTLNSAGDEIKVNTAYSSGTSLAADRATGIDGKNPFCSPPSDAASCPTPTLPKYIYVLNGARREVGQIASTYTSGTDLTLAVPAGATDALVYNYPVGSIVRTVETVTYTLTAYASCPTPLPSISGMSCLTRSVDGGAAQTLVENVTVTGLTLTYYDSAGAAIADTSTQANRNTIREISISLTTQGNDGSRRTMTSRVRPRSLGVLQE